MSRRGKVVVGVMASAAAVIVGFQLWGPAPKECDGPCSGWEWDLVIGLAVFAVIVALVLGAVGYAVWSIIKSRRPS
jgi:hypothetical protein